MTGRVVVAGFGNVLRRDDAFGIRVLEELEEGGVPDGVSLFEVGIGGVHLVQDLMGAPADALVVLDAVELGRPAGTVVVVEPDVVDTDDYATMDRRELLADMHYATPDRALMMLRAMGVLPAATIVVGCETVDVDTLAVGLTPPVAAAVAPAASEVRRAVRGFGVEWSDPAPVG